MVNHQQQHGLAGRGLRQVDPQQRPVRQVERLVRQRRQLRVARGRSLRQIDQLEREVLAGLEQRLVAMRGDACPQDGMQRDQLRQCALERRQIERAMHAHRAAQVVRGAAGCKPVQEPQRALAGSQWMRARRGSLRWGRRSRCGRRVQLGQQLARQLADRPIV